MANVNLPANTWVDLYTATGLSVGTQIRVLNITSRPVRLASTASTPTTSDDHVPLPFNTTKINNTTDLGAWALSISGGAVDVQEV